MPDCSRIDALVTPYVDGELPSADRDLVTGHIAVCSPCRAKVATEQAVRTLLRARCTELGPSAPPALRSRCAALGLRRPPAVVPFPAAAASSALRAPRRWRSHVASVSIAAALLMAVGSLVYVATDSSTRVLAAELTADHEKCLRINRLLGTHQTPQAVEVAMASGFGWHVDLPDLARRPDVSLVGSRPCLYGEGLVAHIMFTHNGQPVSLFMLRNDPRKEEALEVLGHQCRIWSLGDRTFVLVASAGAAPLDDMARLMRTTIR